MNWYLGTIGFAYPEWRGSFYPISQRVNQSLSYYSKYFNCVEINTSFYGPPSTNSIQKWISQTPEDFQFCFKTPRKITHEMQLQNTGREMNMFLKATSQLGTKLGAILIQFPPGFSFKQIKLLDHFLSMLPKDFRFAVEFRNPDWYLPDTAEILANHSITWAATQYENLPMTIYPTLPWIYIRWIGKHNVLPHPGHEVIDRKSDLEYWFDQIQKLPSDIQTIYGFFDNDFAGHAPESCQRFKWIAGLGGSLPEHPKQQSLFD